VDGETVFLGRASWSGAPGPLFRPFRPSGHPLPLRRFPASDGGRPS
jgi:hypothetical protein